METRSASAKLAATCLASRWRILAAWRAATKRLSDVLRRARSRSHGGAVSENAARQPAALAPNEPSTTRSSRRTRSVDARRTHQPRHRGAEDAGPRRRVGRRDEERHSRHPLPVRWRRGHRATRTCDSSRRRWDNRSSSRRSHRVRRSTTCTCRSRCAMTLRPAAMSRMPGDPGDDAAGL